MNKRLFNFTVHIYDVCVDYCRKRKQAIDKTRALTMILSFEKILPAYGKA